MSSEIETDLLNKLELIGVNSTINEVDISHTQWQDNKTVSILSTFAGKLSTSRLERFDKKSKTMKQVVSSHAVTIYNKPMGGVDLLDICLGRQNIQVKTRKLCFRLFYHLPDVKIINAWVLYNRVVTKSLSSHIRLKDFAAKVGEGLCKVGIDSLKKRGRPPSQSTEELILEKKK